MFPALAILRYDSGGLVREARRGKNLLIIGLCPNGLDPPLPLFSWTPMRHFVLDEKNAGKNVNIVLI